MGSDARDIRPTGVMKMVNNLRNGDWMVGSYVIGTFQQNSNEVVRIIDGAHRIEAVRILRASNDPGDEKWRDFKIPAIVFPSMEHEKELALAYRKFSS